MKANELRIGNWLIDKRLGKTLQFTSFYGLTNVETWPEDFEPIPLTPEILEKVDWAGYKKFSINSYFKIDDVGHLYYSGDYTGININYLHQLQNLYFALTATELTIKF